MLMKLSEKLAALRTDRPDEWTMDELLRDACLLEVKYDELRQRLEEICKQQPVAIICGTYKGVYSIGNVLFPDGGPLPDRTPLYLKPLPADKPAAVACYDEEEWKIVPKQHTPEMESAFQKGVGLEGNFFDGYECMLLAAPYHSQQSADKTSIDYDIKLIHAAARHLKMVMNEHPYCDHVQVVKHFADIRRDERLIADRCPSHESDQSPVPDGE